MAARQYPPINDPICELRTGRLTPTWQLWFSQRFSVEIDGPEPADPSAPVPTAPTVDGTDSTSGFDVDGGPWTIDLNLGATPAVGSLLVVCLVSYDPPESITDNHGNTFALAVSSSATLRYLQIWTAKVEASGGTHTVTATYGGDAPSHVASLAVTRISGQSDTPVGVVGNGTNTSATPVASVGIRDQAGETVIGCVSSANAGSVTITPDAGWTELAEVDETEINAAKRSLNVISQAFTDPGLSNPSWTLSASKKWVACGVAVRGV